MSRRSDDFGVELQRRRLTAGLSLADLATRIHYSRGYLSKIENGRKPGLDLVRLCDAALDANGELIALVARQQTDSESTSVDGDDPVWVMGMDLQDGGWFASVGRRDVVLSAGAVAMAGLPLSIFTKRANTLTESPAATFRDWFAEIRGLGQQQESGSLLPLLIGLTHTLRTLVTSVRPAARPELLALAARYAEYTGWMTQESGDDRMALWWTRRAVELANAGADSALNSYSLVRQALIALYRDDATQTVELAHHARADATASPRVRGLAAIREAQGQALAGYRDQAFRALDQARTLLDISGKDVSGGLMLGTSNLTDPVTMISGWCLYDLGLPDQAAAIFDRELARVPSRAHRTQARYGVRRALAHAASGEVDYACDLTRGLLPDLLSVNSATIRVELRRLTKTLARWNNHGPVRELLPDLNTALRTPST